MSGRRRVGLWLLLMALPFATLGVVNAASPAATRAYDPARCTRYCHDHGCPHARATLDPSRASHRLALSAYRGAIRWLHHNPLAVSYGAMNLILFVAAYPALAGLLLYLAMGPWRRR